MDLPPIYAFHPLALPFCIYSTTTRGAALPQTPLLALIRRESNALGFVVTVVVNSGSTAVVVATLVLAATVAAVLIAELIAVLNDSGSTSGSSNSCGDRRRCRRCRMRDRQDAQLTGPRSTECTVDRC